MISILAASVVGSWSYAGFLAEPSPTPAPAPPPAAVVPFAPEPELELESDTESEKKEEVASTPVPATAPPTKPEATPPPIVPSPARYRLTDATGQIWEHADPVYLAQFVEARNNAFTIPPATFTYYSAQPSRASRCYGGRCN